MRESTREFWSYICIYVTKRLRRATRHHKCFWIISRTSSMTSHALCPPITSAFHSPSFHSCNVHSYPISYLNATTRVEQRTRKSFTHLNSRHFLNKKDPRNISSIHIDTQKKYVITSAKYTTCNLIDTCIRVDTSVDNELTEMLPRLTNAWGTLLTSTK